jgi:spoIIIJ-associated protein
MFSIIERAGKRSFRNLPAGLLKQVLATGRKQYLEPMPANERRIIHMELRKNDNVSTESTGEEPNRKVCVFPKR